MPLSSLARSPNGSARSARFVLGALGISLAFAFLIPEAEAQQTTLQSDDGSMEQVWSLTSPQSGPGDWVAVAYEPPFEFPFRVVNASMFFLDTSCCSNGSCSDALCLPGADWERRVIARQNLAVDSAGLTPDVASVIAEESNVQVGAGSNRTAPPWTMTPATWSLPQNTVFDAPGRIFYAIKYFDQDQWMRFAVDSGSSGGTSVYTTDSFATRSAIWSFGNIGMRIAVEPIFNIKLAAAQPAASFQLASAPRVPMLVLRVGAGNASTTVTRLRVTGRGSGNEATAVDAVRLVIDADRDGAEGNGEVTIASGTFASNDGSVDLSFSRSLIQGSDEQWLVVYDLDTSPAGGATFSAQINAASDVSSNLGAPFMSGTSGGTGAISGGTITIAGRLAVSRGPASMPAQIVGAGAQNLATLQIRLSAENEAFDVSQIALSADGTVNDIVGVSSVRLYHDADSSGTMTASDALLGTGSFTQDNGRLSFSFAPIQVPANGARDLLAVYNLSGSASGGETVRTLLATGADLLASGIFSGALPASGPRALVGPPVIGHLATVGGALVASLGAASSAAGTAQPGAVDIPMLQLQLQAQAENVSITALTFAGSGTGDEARDVSRVRLYRDANNNGLKDTGDILIGLPQSYAADDGIVTFAFPAEIVPAGASRLYLVTYDFGSMPTGGETFNVRLRTTGDVTAAGQSSGASISASGSFPLLGGTKTLLGGLSITVGAENPPAANHQPGASDVPVLQLALASQGEDFSLSSLRITASGSLADASGIARAELWRDQGALGLRDGADTLLATSSFMSDDGSALFALATPRTLAPGAGERWLVTYDLTSTPEPGQTFRASIALTSDVVATGTLSGAAQPSGLPIMGQTHAIGGTVLLSLGPANPAGGTLSPSAQNVAMLQVRLAATLEPVTISGITFTGAGSGNEMTGIREARLYLDADQDGEVDTIGDVPLGTPQVFAQNDGTLAFGFAPRTIPVSAREDWLLAYALTPSVSAGDTFQTSVALNTDVVAAAPSGPIPRASGAPVAGNVRTVLGALEIARGAQTPASATVPRSASDVPVLQLTASGDGEAFRIAALTFHALGSVDDVGDLAGVTLLEDSDGSGTRTNADIVLAGPVAFSGDDGSVTFQGLSVDVPLGGMKVLLATVDLSGTGAGGATLRLSLSSAADVLATGLGGRVLTSARGLPVSSETLRIGGRLEVALGSSSPAGRVVERGMSAVDALQLRFVATTEAAELASLTLHASGSGHDAMGVASVDLYLDANGNGLADAGELHLGTRAFTSDDGAAVFPLSQAVQVGPAVAIVARMAFAQTIFGGETFQLTLDPARDVGVTSASGAVTVDGPPLSGALLTAGGGFEVRLGPQSIAGAPVNQSLQNVAVLQLELTAVNEACTVDGLSLRAAGSIDDASDVARVRLLRDVNGNGLVDFADVEIGGPATFNTDDGVVVFSSLARTLGQDASERWLVAYDLAGSASHLETFMVRLERNEDILVHCNISGNVVPDGAPIESATFTIQEDGALVLSRGSRSPPGLFIPEGSVRVPVMQVRLGAAVQDLIVREVAMAIAASNGSPQDTVLGVELFRDLNQDGVLDRADPPVGTSPVDAQGRVVFSGLSIPVQVAEAAYLLATVNLSMRATPGTTFTVRIASDADVRAFSALGDAIITGAPVQSEVMTVAGHINVAAVSPPADVVVHNDERGLVALDFTLLALWESFTLRGLTVTSEGSMEASDAVQGISLAVDENGNGALESSDRVLVRGLTFAQGTSRALFAGLSEMILPARSKRMLVLFDLAGTARVDQTIALSIAANVDVIVDGDRVGLTFPIGAPVLGSTFTIGPSLEATQEALPDVIVPANAAGVPALAFDLHAFNEDVTVSRLSLRASGSLEDAVGIHAVRLYLDLDANGRVDPGDIEVSQPMRPAGDDGAVSFAPLAERLSRNASAAYLVTVDLSGSGAAGETLSLRLASDADVTAFGAISGGIGSRGAPIAGPRIALVGALNVLLGPASPAGIGVEPGTDFSALQLELFTRGEAVTIEAIALRLEGTADDGAVVKAARLWRDPDGDGLVSEGDLVIANSDVDGDDGLLTFESLALDIPADDSLRLIAEIEIESDATPGGTIRVVLASNDHVRASGRTSGAIKTIGAPLAGSAFTIVRRGAKGSREIPPADGCGCSVAGRGAVPSSETGLFSVLGLALLSRRRRRPRALDGRDLRESSARLARIGNRSGESSPIACQPRDSRRDLRQRSSSGRM